MKILPCPFCGSDAEKTYKYILTKIPAITCSNEYCPAKPFVTGSSYENAIEDWNTRPDYSALKVATRDYIEVSDVPRIYTDYCAYCDEDITQEHKADCKFRLAQTKLISLLDK